MAERARRAVARAENHARRGDDREAARELLIAATLALLAYDQALGQAASPTP